MKKNLFYFLVAAFLAFGLLAACVEPQPAADVPVDTPAEAPAVVPADTNGNDDVAEDPPAPAGISFPGMPEGYEKFPETVMDLGGRTLRVASSWGWAWTPLESNDGAERWDILRSDMMLAMMERYNFELEIVGGTPTLEQVVTFHAAGDSIADIVENQTNIGGWVTMFANYMEPLCIHPQMGVFEFPWNPHFKARNAEGLVTGVGFNRYEVGGFLLFNKDKQEEFGIECIYTLVRNGEWTWDKWMEINAIIFEQNTDEEFSVFGTMGNTAPLLAHMIFANGGEIIGRDANGDAYFAIGSDAGLRAMQMMRDLFQLDYMNHATTRDESNDVRWWRRGHMFWVLCHTWFLHSASFAEHNFGVVPFPSGPDFTGEGFRSPLNITRIMGIPYNTGNLYENMAILKAVANVFNAHYTDLYDMIEDMADNFFRDEDSIEMMHKVIQGLVADYHVTIPDFALWGFGATMRDGTQTPREYIESVAAEVQAILDEYNNWRARGR